jgi:hypothetical protein
MSPRAQDVAHCTKELVHWLATTPLWEQVCERCGCATVEACEGGCHWVAPGICSRCAKPALPGLPPPTKPRAAAAGARR